MNGHHVHVGGLAILGIVAIVYVSNVLIRTTAAHHSDSPIWQGLVYGF